MVKLTRMVESVTGTGKGLVARAIHMMSPRSTRAFIGENCAALSQRLIEIGLFDHV